MTIIIIIFLFIESCHCTIHRDSVETFVNIKGTRITERQIDSDPITINQLELRIGLSAVQINPRGHCYLGLQGRHIYLHQSNEFWQKLHGLCARDILCVKYAKLFSFPPNTVSSVILIRILKQCVDVLGPIMTNLANLSPPSGIVSHYFMLQCFRATIVEKPTIDSNEFSNPMATQIWILYLN